MDATTSDGLRGILFMGVGESAEFVAQAGADRELLVAKHELLLAKHGGNAIETMGDSFMAWFSDAASALDGAISVQRGIAAQFGDARRIRIGVHAAEPIPNGDFSGTDVVRASRIMGRADGGQILVSQVVTDLVEGKGYLFSDAGEFALKGYKRAVHLFDVGWEAE